MKILWIASAFPPAVGGSAHLYANICRQLRRAAVVLAPRRSYENGAEFVGWSKWDEQQPFKVFRLDMLRPQYRPKPKTLVHGAVRWYCEDRPIEKRVLVESLRIIREECVDVVCLGELYSLHALGHAVRRRQGVPLIYYIHGEEITVVPPARRYVWGAFKALRDADGIIAVSSFTRDQLIRRVGVSPTRIHLITNGVDTILFSPGPKDIELVRRYGLSGKKVLLTVGRLEPRKGHDTVLRALPEITRQVPQTVYMIVGKGSQLDRLRNMVTEHGLADQVIFATDVSTNDLVRFYRTADAFVMPNRVMPNGDTEGFGLVFLEAGACGKPVIGGNAGGVPDAVSHGETGLLVDGRSATEVAAACVRLLTETALADRLGAAGLGRAVASSWDRKAQEFQLACDKVLGKRT